MEPEVGLEPTNFYKCYVQSVVWCGYHFTTPVYVGTPLRYCPSYPGSKPGISLSDSQRISLVPPARIELAFQLSQSRVFSTIRRRDNCSSFVLTCWFPLLIYRELPKRRMSPAPESDRAIRVCNPAHNRSANRTYFW